MTDEKLYTLKHRVLGATARIAATNPQEACARLSWDVCEVQVLKVEPLTKTSEEYVWQRLGRN